MSRPSHHNASMALTGSRLQSTGRSILERETTALLQQVEVCIPYAGSWLPADMASFLRRLSELSYSKSRHREPLILANYTINIDFIALNYFSILNNTITNSSLARLEDKEIASCSSQSPLNSTMTAIWHSLMVSSSVVAVRVRPQGDPVLL